MKWLDESVLPSLDCGSNSCRYAQIKGGMRTNGPCRCTENKGRDVERHLLRNYQTALNKIDVLQASIEIDKILGGEDANS